MIELTITQKQSNNIKIRESGIELLRILSIFFVIVIHEITTFLDAGNLFVVISRIITWPAIFSFAFITGYFLIFKKNTENKIPRFLWLTLEIVIWRVVVAFIFLFVITFVEHYSVGQFFYHFFNEIILTLFDVKSWYFWAIIFIYLIFPFFSSYLNNNYHMGKKLLGWILIFLILISIIATIAFFLVDTLGYNFSLYKDPYTIVIVLLASLMGAYWHLIEQEKKIQYTWKLQLIGLIGLLVVYIINFSCIWWWKQDIAVLTYLNIFWYLAGCFYFLLFKGFKFNNKFINWWSSLSWWIYIMHNGTYLPRGWAPRITRTMNIDPYSATILTIIFCYFLTILLVLAIQNFDKFVFKPYVIVNLKVASKKKKSKNSRTNNVKKFQSINVIIIKNILQIFSINDIIYQYYLLN